MKCAFFRTASAPTFASWLHQSLPLFSFVLHSFSHFCVGDGLQYTCVMALVQDLSKCSAGRSSFILFFARIISQSVWKAGNEMKHRGHSMPNQRRIVRTPLRFWWNLVCLESLWSLSLMPIFSSIHHIVSDLWPQIFWIFYKKMVWHELQNQP